MCVAYLVITTGEQMLSPMFPTASADLGLNVAQGGIAFGLLTGSIAVHNLVGGWLLRRIRPGALIRVAAAVSAGGCVITALAGGLPQLLVGQIVVGAGAGLFFPAGLQVVPALAGASRKGFAMGIYGVAFSGGLTLAAILGTLGAAHGWRVAFWVGAGLGLLGLLAGGHHVGAAPVRGTHAHFALRRVLVLPTAVGSVLAIAQYGTVAFLTTFAVDEWGITAASAAAVLVVARVGSIATKIVGGAVADRVGARVSARRTGIVLSATGLAWALLPGGIAVYALAAIFAAMVSSLGPVANLLAVEYFGRDGMLLGAYRSIQIGFGAAAGAIIGLCGSSIGLRPVLAVSMLIPLSLVWMCREPAAEALAATPG